MKKMLRRVGAGVAVVLMAVTGVVVTTGSASAAIPLCVKMIPRDVGERSPIEVPANSDSRDTCLIERGSVANTKIAAHLQRTMIRCYGSLSLASPYQNEKIRDLDADGSFGPRTEAALKAVQKYIGVTADASYGPITRDHMKFVSTSGGECYSYR